MWFGKGAETEGSGGRGRDNRGEEDWRSKRGFFFFFFLNFYRRDCFWNNEMRLDRVFFSHSRGLMSWHFTGAIGYFQRLRFVLLHTVQYPRYCTGYESATPNAIIGQQNCGILMNIHILFFFLLLILIFLYLIP